MNFLWLIFTLVFETLLPLLLYLSSCFGDLGSALVLLMGKLSELKYLVHKTPRFRSELLPGVLPTWPRSWNTPARLHWSESKITLLQVFVFLLSNIRSCCTLPLLWSAVRTLKPDLVFPWSQQNVWQESFPGTTSTSPHLPVTRWAAWGKQSHTTGRLSRRSFPLTVLSALSCRLGTLSWSRRMRPFPVTWSSFPATGETGRATSPPPAWTENPAIK